MNCYYLNAEDDSLFNNRSKRPGFLLRLSNSMLKFEVDRLSIQQLEYEMNRTDYPVDYNFCEIGYCGHPNFPYTNIKLKQATILTP